jgi:hypothetical protein
VKVVTTVICATLGRAIRVTSELKQFVGATEKAESIGSAFVFIPLDRLVCLSK